MDERMKESISALMDDEANELEIQRVLSNMDEDSCQTWHRYHQVRQVVRECGPELVSIDVRSAVAASLGEEPAKASTDSVSREPATSTLPQRKRWLPSMAIAASAVLALFFATQTTLVESPSGQQPLVAENAVETAPATPAVRQPKVHVEFDERHARRFNEYLLRHAGHSAFGSSHGVMPLARVASVNSVGI